MSGGPAPRAVAVLPVKRLADAKQRLRGALGPDAVALLVDAMAADVLAALGAAAGIGRTVVVTAEPSIAARAGAVDALVLDDPEQGGHSDAAWRGLGEALRLGAEVALVVPGDCPLLSAAEIEDLLARVDPPTGDPDPAPEQAACIVPDRHGTGTNALVLRPPAAMRPAFGPGSFERHRALAAQAGATVLVARPEGLALDLDTPEDLAELEAALRADPGRAPVTAAALRTLGAREALQ